MIFRFNDKEYQGPTAVEVVRQIERVEKDSVERTDGTVQQFIAWSLKKLGDRLPPRELDLSPRISDEIQARGYLSLRHDYGIGELVDEI